MKVVLITLFVLVVQSFSYADSTEKDITIKIRGMVCAFCAQGISKKFRGIESVDTVKVDLDNKVVRLTTKVGKLISDEKIKEAVTDSGFNLENIERSSK